jgi:hypothetical protein
VQQKFKKYKLKKEDSLESLAKMLNKPKQELRNFHNVFCKPTELIAVDIPEQLKYLYIYPSFEIEEIERKPKVKFVSDSVLVYKPELINDSYGVMHTITDGDEVNTIKFEIAIKFLKRIQQHTVFEINRISDLFVNDEQVNTIADELAAKVSEVLYPLQLMVNEKGKWVSVYNYDTILSRWEKQKEKILNEFEGEWVEDYLEQNNFTLSDEDLLNNALKKDWSLYAFFNDIYINYTNKYEINKGISFPLLPENEPVKFYVKQNVNKYLDEDKMVQIKIQGNVKDNRSVLDFVYGYNVPVYEAEFGSIDKLSGEYYATYFLNEHNKLETAYISSFLQLDRLKKVEVVVSIL